MDEQNKYTFDFHDCTLEKLEKTESTFMIFLIPCRGILSDINHICFYRAKTLRNELLPEDFGQSDWITCSVLRENGAYEATITFQNKIQQNKNLTLQFEAADIVTDDVGEQKALLNRAKKDGRLLRFLSAQSDLRVAKRWAKSEFFSNAEVPQLLLNSIINAVMSLPEVGHELIFSRQEMFKNFCQRYADNISDLERYTPVFDFCTAYKPSEQRKFTKEECDFFIDLSTDFLDEIKALREI